MTDTPTATSTPSPTDLIVREAPKDAPKAMSIEDAGRMLASARRAKREAAPLVADTPIAAAKLAKVATPKAEETPTSDESADNDQATEVETELPADDAGDTASEESPGEDEGQDTAAEKLPPIERPRSWSKDDDDEWNALPRARQEKIVANERAREADISRRMTEAAEKAKAVSAKEQAAEQVRTQYETKLASVREILENEQRRDFPDIKSQQDLDNIAGKIRELSGKAQQLMATDPLGALSLRGEADQLRDTLQAWNDHQRKLQAVDREQKAADQRKTTERRDSWMAHIKEQNALLAEKIPDMKDAEKGKALRERGVERLSQLGFTNDELTKLANGEEKISVFDHRFHQLINDSLRLADVQKARKTVATKVAAKPVPAVVKPGTPQPTNPVASQNRKALESKLTKTGKIEDAVAVLMARRGARR